MIIVKKKNGGVFLDEKNILNIKDDTFVRSIKKLYNERYSKYRAEDTAQLSMLPQTPGNGWMKCREAIETLKGRTTYKL